MQNRYCTQRLDTYWQVIDRFERGNRSPLMTRKRDADDTRANAEQRWRRTGEATHL